MKHAMITFRLHRKGVVLVSIGAVLLGALLFAAGYLTARRAPALQGKEIAAPAPQEKKAEKQESAATPHIEDEAFTLRVGAFADEADAKAFVQELATHGHKTVVAPVAEKGTVLHMVLLGRYAGRDAAAEAAAELKRKDGIASAVVPAARGN